MLLLLHQLVTVMERVEDIYERAGEKKHWKTVRLAAAILGKVVDTLAPSITSMLVRGKEVSVVKLVVTEETSTFQPEVCLSFFRSASLIRMDL